MTVERLLLAGQRPLAGPTGNFPVWPLHLGLLGDLKCVVNVNSKIAYGAFELAMTEQQLHRSEVLGAAIDQCRLGPTHGMRAVRRRIEADFLDPLTHDPGVLPRAEVRRIVHATGKPGSYPTSAQLT